MTTKQRTWGQFATPPDLADLLLGFCLRQPSHSVLDPSCGDGVLLRRAAYWQSRQEASGEGERGPLYGIELDAAAASAAQAALPQAHITTASFFALHPDAFEPFDAIIGNPPYTRSEWIERLEPGAEAQLSAFPAAHEPHDSDAHHPVLPYEVWSPLGGRAGLHAYFFLHSLGFLREGGRLGFVVPNGWLDVDYGARLKQFLLDHFRIIAVIDSAVERWFEDAGVNTCIIILEKSSQADDRAANRVRFVHLRAPLGELLSAGPNDSQRVGAVEQVMARILPSSDRHSPSASVRVVPQAELPAAARWGKYLRAPDVYWHKRAPAVVPLRQWATIHRGYTTGANSFFYLSRETVEQWRIEPECRRPLLKSLRRAHRLEIGAELADQDVLLVPPGAADLQQNHPRTVSYLGWGVAQGIHERRTCAGREPWYALPPQGPAPLLLAKGVWQRHFAARLLDEVAVDQQLYRVEPAEGVSVAVAAALLNSAWFALQCELHGRVNLGEGVLWLATYELDEIQLPDPRELSSEQIGLLEERFARLAARPIGETTAELNAPDRRELDEAVFDVLGLSADERDDVRAGLAAALTGRLRRARSTA